MIDAHGRELNYLRISVTDRCNLRCHYCMPPEGVVPKMHEAILTYEEIVEIASAAVDLGVKKIRLTGGEPLVRRGIVDLCINLAKLKNKGLEELCLTTNGSLLSKFAEPLRRAGVDRLNVSLDTPSAELYKEMTRGGDIEDVFAGLKKAREVGFTGTKINAVLINDFNDLDLRTLSEWTRKYPIDVRWIELMPIGEAAEWHKESFLSCETVLTVIPELEYVGEKGVATLYRFPDGKGHVGLIRPLSHHFCSTCTRLRLTADGYLKTCLHSRGEIQLRGLSGNELKAAFRRAAADKPWEHHLNERGVSDTIRYMNQIGG